MNRCWLLWLLVMSFVLASISGSAADDGAAALRRQLSQEFHVRSQERTGLQRHRGDLPGSYDAATATQCQWPQRGPRGALEFKGGSDEGKFPLPVSRQLLKVEVLDDIHALVRQ